nr:hypothetical protein B0A51_03640 [Rachicladosporium sp. CCFEE 5018]
MADDNEHSTRQQARWRTYLEPHDQRLLQHRHQQPPASQAPTNTTDTETDAWDPFIAFKHFVDARLHRARSAMAHDLRSWHDELSPLAPEMEEDEETVLRRWTGRHTGPLRGLPDTPMQEEREAAVMMLLRQSLEKNRAVPVVKMARLYDDPEFGVGEEVVEDAFGNPMLSMGGACYYKPETDANLPSTAVAKAGRGAGWRWLSVDWFKRDKYSPVVLESHPILGDYDTKWRNAFEDLLEAALDKPMTSTNSTGFRPPSGPVISAWKAPGLDWMLSLQCKGVLPPQLPSLYEALLGRNGRSLPSVDGQMFPLRQHPYSLRELSMVNYEPWVLRDKDVRSEFQQLVTELRTPPVASHGQQTAQTSLSWARPQIHGENWEANDDDSFRQDPIGHVRRMAKRGQLSGESLHEAAIDALTEAVNDNDELLKQIEEAVYAGLLNKHEAIDAREFVRADRDEIARSFDSWVELTELDMYEQQRDLKTDIGADDVERAMQEVARQESGDYVQGECPDPVGRQVARAMRGESGCPDPVGREVTLAMRQQGGCPDELGRAVAEAAREQSGCPDELGRQMTRLSMCPALAMDEDDDEEDEDGDEDDDQDEDEDDLPGELWSPHHIAREVARSQAASAKSGPQLARPQVLSALTTTHTTRSADGTVVTKVVLQRRFADGSEESHENVHTYQDEQPVSRQQTREESKAEQKRKGWFWS